MASQEPEPCALQPEPIATLAPPSSDSVQPPSSPSTKHASDPANLHPTTAPNPPSTPNTRLTALTTKQARLQQTLATLQSERANLASTATLSTHAHATEEEQTQAALTSAHAVIKTHIALLHRYNEVKDVAQGLIGMIAEGRGERVGVVMKEFGVGEKD